MRTLADSTLLHMKKSELIEHLRCAEHNQAVAEERLAQHIENVKDWIPVVRCGTCKSSEPIPENSGFYKGNWLHCRKWRGELTENVWHPKEKCWKDWSVTTPEGFCDDGEARDENEEEG